MVAPCSEKFDDGGSDEEGSEDETSGGNDHEGQVASDRHESSSRDSEDGNGKESTDGDNDDSEMSTLAEGRRVSSALRAPRVASPGVRPSTRTRQVGTSGPSLTREKLMSCYWTKESSLKCNSRALLGEGRGRIHV